MTKGDLMKQAYTPEELRNVDNAIPIHLWSEVDTSIHVMDYNNSALGELVNLKERIAENAHRYKTNNVD